MKVDIRKKLGTHSYEVPVYAITKTGLTYSHCVGLDFVRGSKVEGENKIEKQAGLIIENLIEVLIDHLKTVNVGALATDNTTSAIFNLEGALKDLQRRSKDRIERKVINTYEK